MQVKLKEIWSEQKSSSDKLVVRQEIPLIKGLNCFVGLIAYTGAKMFQLEVDSSIDIHKNYLKRFKGVEIQVVPNETGSLMRFSIILIEKELTDIFTLFIEDIIEKLVSVSDPRVALTLINQRVNYWRKLFARVTGEILSPEKQRGLFGELYILQLFLNNSENKVAVLNSWFGSQRANQDFAIETNAVEVKTSKAGNPSVMISNEHQLDYSSWSHLYLCLVMVNESAGKHGTLYDQIYEIKTLLKDSTDLIQEFEHKLSLAGISEETIENYKEISYSVRNYRFFEVKEGFPAITRGTLFEDAIYNVKYQVDIKQCKDFEIEEEDVLTTLL